jgi:hypothetical protein
MLNPRSPYSRRMWHYESDRPLSVAQLIALGSVDARTAALLWLLLDHHASLIVSGPTDPTPGIGKTTTLNALLALLPGGSSLVYTAGMYEDFSFRELVDPATTWVLANEVSDHLVIYMWDDAARTLLTLPADGFAVATSCHADTVEDVLDMLLSDLRLPPAAVARLGVIVNIGLVGRVWPPRRRFLTVNFVSPELVTGEPANASARKGVRAARRAAIRLLPLARWDDATDAHVGASPGALTELARVIGVTNEEIVAEVERRATVLDRLAQGGGVGPRAFREQLEALTPPEGEAEVSDAPPTGDDATAK